MSEPSLKKNLALSTVYQVLTMIIPFVTAPYISRVLGANGVGIYSFTNSIQMYFSMFAALGTVGYGTREIAIHRSDRKQRSQLFWEIELLTVLTSFACLVAWGIFIFISNEYKIYYAILTFALLASLFDISWLYTGLEQFKYTVTQNTVYKLLGVAALFIFVKKSSDIPIYVLIMALTTLLSNVSMWIYLPKFVDRIPLKTVRLKRHFKETLIYFIPTIATSIYTILDKTLIGIITKEEAQNGYYEQATKIVNMAKTLTFAAMNNVLGSRISYLFAEKKTEEIKTRIHFSMEYILFVGMGICFGLLAVSRRLVPLFFGDGYDPVIELLYLLSPIVIIIGISNCLGAQYYNPAGLRSKSAKFIIAGSVVNLILNICLIPIFKSQGAVVASLAAEGVIAILYLKNCDNYYKWVDLMRSAWKKLMSAGVMLSVLMLIENLIDSNEIGVCVGVITGIVVYVAILYAMRDRFVLGMFERLKTIVKR